MSGPPFDLHPLPSSKEEILNFPGLLEIKDFLEVVRKNGGRPIIVGGFVRDMLFYGKFKGNDIDIEIFNINYEDLKKLVFYYGGKEHGKSFGVFTLNKIEIALPRRERKIGKGHKGFKIDVDPYLSFRKASLRRDVTINAMGIDPWTCEFFDPHGGRIDLSAGIIRHTSDKFSEDPLRVLRVMQFAARFGFAVHPETIYFCRNIDLKELPVERIWGEWKKLLLQGIKPSFGLEFLRKSGAIRFFPELEALTTTPQDEGWHPEGTVWEHTLLAMDRAAELRTGNKDFDIPFMLGVLCHDLGKPLTTKYDEEKKRIVSPKHESKGEIPTRSFLERITKEKDVIEKVVVLVRRHMAPHHLYKEKEKGIDVKAALKRLALKVDPILLERVARADHFGRKTEDAIKREYPAGEWFLKEIKILELEKKKPKPIVMGRHLLKEGVEPGPEMGRWLKTLFAAQINGRFSTLEEGLKLFREWRDRKKAKRKKQ